MPTNICQFRTKESDVGYYTICSGRAKQKLDEYLDQRPVHCALYGWKAYYLTCQLINEHKVIVEGENPLWLTVPYSNTQEGLDIFYEWCRVRVDLRLRNKPPGVNRKKMRWQRYASMFLQCGFQKFIRKEGDFLKTYADLGGISVVCKIPEIKTVNDLFSWTPFRSVCEFFTASPTWLTSNIPRKIKSSQIVLMENWTYAKVEEEEVDEADPLLNMDITALELENILQDFDF
jgi:hypothetical protein